MSLNGCFRSWRATQNHARPISMKRGLIVGEHPSRVVAAGRGLNLFAMSLNGCFRSWRATQNHARPILVKRGLIVGEHSSKGCWIVIGLFFWGGKVQSYSDTYPRKIITVDCIFGTEKLSFGDQKCRTCLACLPLLRLYCWSPIFLLKVGIKRNKKLRVR